MSPSTNWTKSNTVLTRVSQYPCSKCWVSKSGRLTVPEANGEGIPTHGTIREVFQSLGNSLPADYAASRPHLATQHSADTTTR